ncbi:hypothetical protein PSECIP111854_01470 [Pseudoalteromonas sp. CIP111854]|uniref:Prepilin-type cleavage/methylation domain-containing protein n=1 Tax=Pseudoalteromonas holothuriae TaxID=2963714 RepID=A0A9W4VP62_9GAMM|nr:prepilin-type N-terminal cleavage/methylation domain-containing protein [Pseudoalteromonas sp. CIP111854]CAH9054910.1 hypothetical protein PSECIP111854_01470 [Pseudoalteromonas sp. CIP111854]
MLKIKGFSLVEVLVSMLVASIALLGLAATQLKSLQYATNSFEYTVSLILGQNAMERVWSQLCVIQYNNPALYNDADFQSFLQPSQALQSKFQVVMPEGFSNGMNITVAWQDDRIGVTDDGTNQQDGSNQVQINATFVQLPPACLPT